MLRREARYCRFPKSETALAEVYCHLGLRCSKLLKKRSLNLCWRAFSCYIAGKVQIINRGISEDLIEMPCKENTTPNSEISKTVRVDNAQRQLIRPMERSTFHCVARRSTSHRVAGRSASRVLRDSAQAKGESFFALVFNALNGPRTTFSIFPRVLRRWDSPLCLHSRPSGRCPNSLGQRPAPGQRRTEATR